MTEKLTLEIVMNYPKAKIKLNNVYSSKPGILRTIHLDSQTVSIDFGERKVGFSGGMPIIENDVRRMKLSDCKLILRPLSSLTENEKNYMNSKKWICNKPNDFWNGFEEAPTQLIQIAYAENRIEVIDYLRSINIDIDGLQEKGVAVYDR